MTGRGSRSTAERAFLAVLCAVIYTAAIVGVVALMHGPMNSIWIGVFLGAEISTEWRYWGQQ